MRGNIPSPLPLCLAVFQVLSSLLLGITIGNGAPPSTTISVPLPGGIGNMGTEVNPSSQSVQSSLCTGGCVITGGTRSSNAANLFHSFIDFNIGLGDTATFLNDSGLATSNILARVTGTQGNNPTLSSIYGSLQTVGFGNANLFLINPAGFLFGSNATVNVGGMVTFTTADYIRFVDGGRFNSNPNVLPVDILSSTSVASFGFLGSDPSAIRFEGGKLAVTDGTGLSLVGGDIDVLPDSIGTPSGISALGRSIQITSVAGPGEVVANTGTPSGGMPLGNITLGHGTLFETNGDFTGGDGSGSGGSISIRGGQLVASGTTFSTGPAMGSSASGGKVTVDLSRSAVWTDSQIITAPVLFSLAGSGGTVSLTADHSIAVTNTTIDTNAFLGSGDGGSVFLKSNGSVSLTDSPIFTNASAPGNGGAVTILGKEVALTRSNINSSVDTGFFDFSIDDPALGLVSPGSVTITAEEKVMIQGSGVDPSFPNPVINASAIGTLLDAGAVTISAKSVDISNGGIDASIHAGTTPLIGNGGTIEIRGNEVMLSQTTLQSVNAGLFESTSKGGNIFIRGADNPLAANIALEQSRVTSDSVSGGGAGNIDFATKNLSIRDSEVLATTLGIGPGGSITVHGAEVVNLESNSRVSTSAINTGLGSVGPFGAAGAILMETEQLTMRSGSILESADLPLSQGNAGSITVRGTNGPAQSILIDGTGTGMFTDAEGNGTGGNINLSGNFVTIQNGGTLSAITSGTVPTATGGSILVNSNTVTLMSGGTMTAVSTGAGASGEVIINGLSSPANSVVIDGPGSGILTTTENTGKGGNIFVDANLVALQNNAQVSSSSTGPGIAGDITINAGNQFTMENSSVTTEANRSSGGAIKITTTSSGTVQLTDSTISASVLDGTGGGGSVNIDPQSVVLINSQILAQAVQGPGGNINITTNLLLPDSSSLISASSQFGQSGTVTIQSPVSPASGKIVPLGQKPLIATSLLSQRCAAIAGGSISSFTVAGRDSLPAEPGGWVSSPLALSMSESEEGTVRETHGTMLDGTPLLSLRKIAPSGFLTQAFAVDASGCQS